MSGYIDLLYLRSRWYAVEAGRFTTPDTIVPDFSSPQSTNRYVYVGNNSLSRTDPTGHWWYDPINNNYVWTGVLYEEILPRHPRIEFYPDTKPYLERDDVFDWIIPRAQQIESQASRHGIPPELVAGILAAEIDDDTEWRDEVVDAAVRQCLRLFELTEEHPELTIDLCGCGGIMLAYANLPMGVGIAQIHISREGYDWWAVVRHYQEQRYTPLPSWAEDPIWTLLSDAGAIEGSAMFSRGLADVRTGINAPHMSDLTLDDMAMIFVGYRYGVGGFTDVLGVSYAFPDIPSFQWASRSILPVEPKNAQRDFDIARPYFDAFQFYFEHRDLYEAEYGNQW